MRPLLKCIFFALMGLALSLAATQSFAQSTETYRIGPEDVVSISFWQQPELNQTVQVRQDGKVAIPVIGEMEIAGLTPEEAASRIVDRISRYNRSISQALVQVVAYNSRKVFVTGQVGKPGKYAYEVVPDLWTAIRDAGGPLETSDLSRVTVVSPSGTIKLVDLAKILSEGKADTLSPLIPGTTVDLPRRPDVLATETFTSDASALRPIVFVSGVVLQPGPKKIEGDMYIQDAIAMAGGVGPDADLGKVEVISKAARGPVTQMLNLKADASDRSALNYRIRYEDQVIVGRKGRSVWNSIRDVATVAAAVSSIILLADQLSR